MEKIKNEKNIPTATVGMPAYNEEANISYMLNYIIGQKRENYVLEKIIVISDGSQDATEEKVKNMAKDHQEVVLVAKKERQGRSKCLNEIYLMNDSDVFITFDADLFINKNDIIEKMISFFRDPEVVLVSANHQPLAGQSFMEKIIVASKNLWYEVRKDFNGGSNVYNNCGCASAMRKAFIKKLAIPLGIINGQQFIYFTVKKEKKRFIFAKDAVVYYRAPVNLKDFFIQANHLKGKYDMVAQYFDSSIVKKEHAIPFSCKFWGLIHSLIKDPFYGALAIVLQASLHILPEKENKKTGNELWQIATSTKAVHNNPSSGKLNIIFLDFDDIKNPLLNAGQARATLEVAKRLVKKGHKVKVISSKYPGYKNRIEEGIYYKHIGLGSKNIRINNVFYILSLPFYVMRLKADIVVECFTSPISTLFSPLFTRIPVVVIPSCFDAERFSRLYHLPFQRIESFGCRFYKYILPYSQHLADKIKKFNPKIMYKIVPEGVGEEFFQIEKKSPKHILFLGRLDMGQKGIDLLLKAYAKIASEISWPLIVAGNGPDEEKVKNLVKELGLEKRVEMTGATYGEKKARYLSEALFVAFPSRNETFSLFALEALASGAPLVSFDIPGLSWNNSTVALKAKPFDIDEYASILKKASQDKDLIAKMSINSRNFAKNFTWNNVTDGYESFFHEVIEKEKQDRNNKY